MSRSALLPFLMTVAVLSSATAAVKDRPFKADRSYRDLVKQCEFGPRAPATRGHDRGADWIVAQLKPLAHSVVRQRFTATVNGKQLQLTNLIATFNPKGARHVLLCAHWDTRPRAECDPDPARRGQPILGANDGASGVAVLLEIARALKARPPKPQVTLVFFDGEDYGSSVATMFLGSRYFARHYTGRSVDWAALLDMVGDKDLRLPQEANSIARAPEVVARIWGAAERAGCTAFAAERGPAIIDDHLPLLDRGIPCADIIDFTYPAWHTTADRPEQCSAESLGQVGRALLRAIAEEEAGGAAARGEGGATAARIPPG